MTKHFKLFSLLVIALLIISCGENKKDTNFTLKGHVTGLKKGTVYLQKQQDSLMVTLDSLAINGNSEFELHSDLEEPEVLFLTLDKNDNNEGVIAFFADKGVTEISSTLKNFNYDAQIKGSEQQKRLDEYIMMMSRFNDKNLDLIKENFEAKKENDTTSFDFDKEYNSLLKRKYLYTINFAVNNKNSEVAPYLALSEIPNTTVKYLETIYDSLDENIKNSKYGKQLKETIEQRKSDEENIE
ncbi:DUF4369 domain-containing protein [Meridianimaribacter flavus]|uniref:Uncharacterized protein DUF4369 n=1 Tax=Meridianimaribacter flavus TaxID=571115 RepID=A0ABY2G9Z7_9FLAO|nr:DUF4369 domain-containing protein [Meridianimaribacter flavus]TDY14277.1 uncharacterized protein DUF4369 [Meridianimaribacter flavus]